MAPLPIFEVSAEVFQRWPTYIVGCVYVSGIRNSAPNAAIEQLLTEAELRIRDDIGSGDPKDLPEVALWRETFSACGWTPSKYLSSVESIVKRVLRGQPIPRISPIVDLANACSLAFHLPIGAHDVTTFAGPLTVRLATVDDRFLPMGDAPPETPELAEIVYASSTSVRTRRWVWRQSRDALILPTTADVFFPIDGFAPETGGSVSRAAEQLAEYARTMFGVHAHVGLVHAGSRTFPSALS